MILKRLFSYLTPQLLEKTHSRFNQTLEVSLVKGCVQLSTENAIYSFEDRYTSFLHSFRKLKIQERKVESVLVLGFGLGSIPIMLRKKFNQNCSVVGVEIDEMVVELFHRHRDSHLASRVELICQDAFEFVNYCQNRFDLVCVDLFLDDVVPSKFESAEFVEKLVRTVNPQGLLLFNRMTSRPALLKTSERFRIDVFEKVLEESWFIDVGGNRMLVWEAGLSSCPDFDHFGDLAKC